MSIIEAVILGLIQGATEFLPVSSSGHLVLLPEIFGWGAADLTLVGIVHLGTLVAILIYFWRDLWQIFTAVLAGIRRRELTGTADARLGWLIAAGSIPAIIAGLLLQDFFDEIFDTPVAAAFFLLVTAALLLTGEKMLSGNQPAEQMGWKDAGIIGVFQSLALFPGLSRSGSTIVGGLLRGLDRAAATRFSFLLGIPAFLGAGLLSLKDIVTAPVMPYTPAVYAAGFLSAAVVGYACIHFLLRWVRAHSLYIFAVYCALLGGGYLVYSVFRMA